MPDPQPTDDPKKPTGLSLPEVASLVMLALVVILFATPLLHLSPELAEWVGIGVKNFRVVVGLPLAAIFAFIIVAFLRQSGDSIEFEGLGFKFKGATGPVILWLLCFIVIAGAIKLLWTD